MRTTAAKAERIEQVIALATRRVGGKEAAQAQAFIRTYFAGVAPEDLLESPPETLFGNALSLWAFLKRRAPATPRVRVYNPTMEEHGWLSTHTIVEVVTDDMPFLVDSIVNALNQVGLVVHLLIHPIVPVARDSQGRLTGIGEGGKPESVQHVQVTRQAGADRLAEIEGHLLEVLASVRAATEDWRPCLERIDSLIAGLDAQPPPLPQDEIDETKAFLAWLRDDHFLFLGFREYRLVVRDGQDYSEIVEGSGLGILRAISPESAQRHAQPLPPAVSRYTRTRQLLDITKATSRSRVHRPVYMDYVGVRRFGAGGEVVGEYRILGLLTSAAYNRNPREIPLLRRKVARVIDHAGFPPRSHNGKALLNILETYPRDELFQIDEATLTETALGILHLEERQRIRLFIRRDSYARFYSCLTFVPRDRYSTDLRERIERILMEALHGDAAEYATQVSESPMARTHFMIHTSRELEAPPDVAAIEERIAAAARDWSDDLRDAAIEGLGEARGSALYQRYRAAFPAGYRDAFQARVAVGDIERIEGLGQGIAMSLYRRVNAPENLLHFKVYHRGDPVPMSDILPMLENMGLRVIEEMPFLVTPEGVEGVWIHDFSLRSRSGQDVDIASLRDRFQDAFAQVWSGGIEDDRFNQLVLLAALTWREASILRAYARYLRQAGFGFSQSYMQETLARNAEISKALIQLFRARFDPDAEDGREARVAAVRAAIAEALDKVASLDEDRILRRFLDLIEATLRTNAFQRGPDGADRPALAFKLDSRAIAELPEPRPLCEIWVYAPRVEAVHLRFGRVARGGIRWSDRREDFRTEVLGLVKAQQVKNAVIVPVGAKGGFVVKRPPAEGGRDAVQAEGIACYRIMIGSMLDVTDNLKGGDVARPERVVRYDGDDPYLVVAADKGTATFSDIANGIALERGFWLGDAFASGGSAGYDHKKMGITARGAWEAVKRHFRELGRDIQSEDFTVVGIGDMAGDVFGNGMLLSRHTKLVAAFNNLHIFLDPDPDPEASFRERERLFNLPRSSWTDYDATLISKGGGVFERRAKSLAVSPEAAARLGIAPGTMTPNDLIRAILKAPVDLLYNGGIGTYVKASSETHAQVGDRANDSLRVDGRELRAKVVGEGGNLGFTQLGRVEYALAGGRINTDAIDNSAGVDCSDHEVNIKILLNDVVGAGDMTTKQRDKLLAEMTDEVAGLVLRDNYQQTQSLSVMSAQGAGALESQGRFMRLLEGRKFLDRGLEYLPNDEALAERQAKGTGLTRPELAVLLAYAKMATFEALLASEMPDDPHFADDLERYFPIPLRERFAAAIGRHRLRREIIATVVTNSLINRVGATFIHELMDRTGQAADDIARAYTVARDTFSLRDLWAAIEALDTKAPASAQAAMMLELGGVVERCTLWFLRNETQPLAIAATVARYRPGIVELAAALDGMMSEDRRRAVAGVAQPWIEAGVPAELASGVARLRTLASGADIVRTAAREGRGVVETARVYFALGDRLGFDWVRDCAGRLVPESHWQRMALQALADDCRAQQCLLAAKILEANGAIDEGTVETWAERNKATVGRVDHLLGDLRAGAQVDLAMLTVANRQLAVLASS
jgi:glutamate dehydrogenase